MLLVVIFGLVALLAVLGVLRAVRQRNILGFLFAGATLCVFGWFAVMTVVNSGYPTVH
ncbi:DUF2759 domain-containing protein [Bacillus sp. ISL-51]|uniref:DUF2759 domain-containing protein n=1 Tax=Bacillus TaxID=1386 RepID=UPI0007DBF158|nr:MULTISPECIES: DUF2759 domain-containing protein [Bacillus]MBT2574429.1 DUF2759 domain-containing protein [Bacillus sp. ISL-51]MBT2633246.1 DUF2759 domain-containing protein [Bacillus sp. ISL-26]MBY8912971.1 DUF2759 domain-containing protein [Bacillus sp. YC2]MCC9023138.1 DUF2759 domain-containing protein [Bacillus nakamurai]MCP6681050.1 DUF2759 domain-containing protein [Bacillus nakamurai]